MNRRCGVAGDGSQEASQSREVACGGRAPVREGGIERGRVLEQGIKGPGIGAE